MLCHVFWSQVEYKIVCFIIEILASVIMSDGREVFSVRHKQAQPRLLKSLVIDCVSFGFIRRLFMYGKIEFWSRNAREKSGKFRIKNRY